MSEANDKYYGVPEKYRRSGLVLVTGNLKIKCMLCNCFIACSKRGNRSTYNFEPYFSSHEMSSNHLTKLTQTMEGSDISELLKSALRKSPRNRKSTQSSTSSKKRKLGSQEEEVREILTNFKGVFIEKRDENETVTGVTCVPCDKDLLVHHSGSIKNNCQQHVKSKSHSKNCDSITQQQLTSYTPTSSSSTPSPIQQPCDARSPKQQLNFSSTPTPSLSRTPRSNSNQSRRARRQISNSQPTISAYFTRSTQGRTQSPSRST
jgi:hypothetical protein